MHRFIWDLRYEPPKVLRHDYPIAAIYKDTPLEPRGTLVLPGNYRVKLTVSGRGYSQAIQVKIDPRIKTTAAGLAAQFDLSDQVTKSLADDYTALSEVKGLRQQAQSVRAKASGQPASALADLDKDLAAFEDARQSGSGFPRLNAELGQLFDILQGADDAPTTQATRAVSQVREELQRQLTRWKSVKTTKLPAVNRQLKEANLPELVIESARPEETIEAGEEEEP